MINKELEVIKLAESYGLKAKWINDVLYVNSKLDEWIICKDNKGRTVLKHKNKDISIYANHEHLQRIYWKNEDYKYIFKDIISHDKFKVDRFKKSRMHNLFDMVSSGNIPKMKLS